jgi:hypothetical protein
VCLTVICVPFCFIVMYVVSLFSKLSYCLVGWYYLSCLVFVFVLYGCFLFFCSLLLYCVFVLFSSSSYLVFVFLYLFTEHCHRVETQSKLIIIIIIIIIIIQGTVMQWFWQSAALTLLQSQCLELYTYK